MSEKEKSIAEKGWWNGLNVIVHDPEDLLPVMYPQTKNERELFVNEHIIHSSKYAEYQKNDSPGQGIRYAGCCYY